MMPAAGAKIFAFLLVLYVFFHPWKLSRLSEYVLEITKIFLGLPAQIFKILVRMLNYRSNSEKPLNYQDLQEGGGTPPPTQ